MNMMGMMNKLIPTGKPYDYSGYKTEYGITEEEFKKRHDIWALPKQTRVDYFLGKDIPADEENRDVLIAQRQAKIVKHAELRDIWSGAAANRQAKAEKKAAAEAARLKKQEENKQKQEEFRKKQQEAIERGEEVKLPPRNRPFSGRAKAAAKLRRQKKGKDGGVVTTPKERKGKPQIGPKTADGTFAQMPNPFVV